MATLTGRTAIVTGAGQGVGRGIALALAGAGADVALLGRTAATLGAVRDEARARGVRAETFVHDVADTAAAEDVVGRVASALGGVDLLVNNAYDGAFGPLLRMSDEDFRRGFTTGPFAALALMRACHPRMKERGGGSIVNLVTSAMVRWDPSGYAAYAAAKSALRSLTRGAAAEWGKDGIRANSLAPLALSPGLQGWMEANPEEAEAFLGTLPLGYVGDCEEDIGRAVVMLASPDARYLTGATLPLDGGQAHFG